jgi:hypothetical protein
MSSKRKAVAASILAILAIVYCTLIFTARYLNCPVGWAYGHIREGETLTETGLTHLVFGASVLWLEQGDHVQMGYEADAPQGALYVELSSLKADGPKYKSVHYLPGKNSGRLVFTIPYSGVYHLSIAGTRRKTPDGPIDKAYDVAYDVNWLIR